MSSHCSGRRRAWPRLPPGHPCNNAVLKPLAKQLRADAKSLNKYHIARTEIEGLNAQGDSTLAPRHEVIKRVVEFEDFSSCWPEDQLRAKGAVGLPYVEGDVPLTASIKIQSPPSPDI